MWCVGVLDAQYRKRMYGLLDLYARSFRREQPVVCVDEKSTQLLAHSRAPLPMKCGVPVREDYEYVRHGTCNLFVALEPGAGKRTVVVTERRGKADFVAFARHLIEHVYRTLCRPWRPRQRGGRLAMPAQPRTHAHPLDVHAARR